MKTAALIAMHYPGIRRVAAYRHVRSLLNWPTGMVGTAPAPSLRAPRLLKTGMASLLRLGTRGSPLALAQAEETRARLRAAHPALAPEGAIEIVPIRTSGDRPSSRTLAEEGGKGLFTKEIEEALLAGAIDLAVHSLKDMPTELPRGLVLAACLPVREDPRDALIRVGRGRARLPIIAPGAVVGTASRCAAGRTFFVAGPTLPSVPDPRQCRHAPQETCRRRGGGHGAGGGRAAAGSGRVRAAISCVLEGPTR